MRKELFPGEQVIVATRPQPRTLIGPALLLIVVAALTAYACAWITKGGPGKLLPLVTAEWTPWLTGACLVVAAWAVLSYGLPRLVAWQGSRYILTSRRLVARNGMLRRRDQQVPLVAVRNVFVDQSLLQRSLRSGNISLDTGYPANTVIPDVPEVMTFRRFILEAMEELPEGEVMNDGGTDDGSDEWPWEMREGGRDDR
ncbi:MULTISPECIES: PH domain-containing protein [unclassified Arthrobacter]|uniref:PH domain-containing protein n=1 Tax=unclassified Arthrobacter TaxID=235627 RepID=UPI0034382B8E